jgi:acetyltransferase
MKPQRWRAADGTRLMLRPMLKSDTPLLKEALGQLSRESRRNRFFSAVREFSDEMVHRLTHFDTATEFALLVVRTEKDREIPLAGGRFVHEGDGRRCEFSLLIGDAWQGQRIGHRILRTLIREASRRGLREMEGHVLADNRAMLKLARSMGFVIDDDPGEACVKLVTLDLPNPTRPRIWRRLFRKLLKFGRK